MSRFAWVGAAVLLGAAMMGCRTHHVHEHRALEQRHAAKWAAVTEAVAVLVPTQGQQARGVVLFTQQGEQVRIVAEVQGLNANGTHGFHIHEFGDATAPDGTSAGGHYDPESHPHAGPEATPRHAGDLGNLLADAQGVARLEMTVDNVTVAGLRNPVIGRAVVVHERADDLRSQPTGDAGGRIAVGVIGVAQPRGPGQ